MTKASSSTKLPHRKTPLHWKDCSQKPSASSPHSTNSDSKHRKEAVQRRTDRSNGHRVPSLSRGLKLHRFRLGVARPAILAPVAAMQEGYFFFTRPPEWGTWRKGELRGDWRQRKTNSLLLGWRHRAMSRETVASRHDEKMSKATVPWGKGARNGRGWGTSCLNEERGDYRVARWDVPNSSGLLYNPWTLQRDLQRLPGVEFCTVAPWWVSGRTGGLKNCWKNETQSMLANLNEL